MSTFEDIETQNGRRFWHTFERIEATERAGRVTRKDLRGRVRGVEAEPDAIVCLPPKRSPRTALHVLGPWAPKLGPVRVEFYDGRVEHMSETDAKKRLGAWFRWTQEVKT